MSSYEFDHRCTYCPEDNKLRFYPDWDDPDFDKEHLKSAGYRWASKQECYVCPRWTPTAEDAALDYVADVGDEDYSPEERAADRAERFSGYRDKRRSEAHGHADTFDAGPSAFGYQSQAKAERAASRHDRHRVKAVSQWSKAEYWQQRTTGVINNALYRSSAKVRRGRLVRLEAEQRKHLKHLEEAIERYNGWCKVVEMDGADELMPLDEDGYVDRSRMNAAHVLAYKLANLGWLHFWHPTRDDLNEECKRIHNGTVHGFTAWDLLTQTRYGVTQDFTRLTPARLAALIVENLTDPREEGTNWQRWSRHYELRTGYENAMLANEGGMAGDVEMEVGGTVGRYVIHRVNKSRASGRVTSVSVLGDAYHNGEGPAPKTLVKLPLERFGQDVYSPPTDESKAKLQAEKAILKAQDSKGPKKPKLVNPTLEDAQRLTALMNSLAQAQYQAHRGTFGEYKPIEPREMTQATYSANAKGSYSSLMTRNMKTTGEWKGYHDSGEIVCKLRAAYPGNNWTGTPYRLVVITDKPQKPLPLDWKAVERWYDERIAEVKEKAAARV